MRRHFHSRPRGGLLPASSLTLSRHRWEDTSSVLRVRWDHRGTFGHDTRLFWTLLYGAVNLNGVSKQTARTCHRSQTQERRTMFIWIPGLLTLSCWLFLQAFCAVAAIKRKDIFQELADHPIRLLYDVTLLPNLALCFQFFDFTQFHTIANKLDPHRCIAVHNQGTFSEIFKPIQHKRSDFLV